jgi:low affinity Fe/Cu permease
MNKKISKFGKWFNYFSHLVTTATGKPAAFLAAFTVVIVWALTGPIFHYSDTWQLVINTGTTVITFLMVFVIQQSQNKDTLALHLKLNELIAANKSASNRLVNIEDLSPEELATLKEFYRHLSILAEKDKNLYTSHSIDEAKQNHKYKMSNIERQVKEAPQTPQVSAP